MIYDANTIDIIGERKEGIIEFFIISSGPFDDSEEQQTILLDKVENYLTYIKSDRFKFDFPLKHEDEKWIVLKVGEEPSPLLIDLCKRIKVWVVENGADFSLLFMNRKVLLY